MMIREDLKMYICSYTETVTRFEKALIKKYKIDGLVFDNID